MASQRACPGFPSGGTFSTLEPVGHQGGTITQTHPADIETFNPILQGFDVWQIAMPMIFNQLLNTNPDNGLPYPELATAVPSQNNGQISADGLNVIADQAVLTGTIRGFDDALLQSLERRFREVVVGIASSLRASASVGFGIRYPPCICDPARVREFNAAASELLGADALAPTEPLMDAEDFGFVLQRVSGAMLWLGIKHPQWPEPRPDHTSRFDIDEAALPIGSALMAGVALRYLSGGSGAARI